MTVREYLARYRGSRVHVLPNPGNGGDGLIARGLRTLADEFDLNVCEIRAPQGADGEVLLILGCGNLCGPYHGVGARAAPYLDRFRTVALMPSSIDPEDPTVRAFLQSLSPAATLFCREAHSAERVRALLGPARDVWVDDDLAFSADITPWQGTAGRGTLYAFRSDAESTGEPNPEGNFDISALTGDWMEELFLDVVADFAVIHTDRAHVAIAAAMLGRETHVYPNAYHKVRGIAEYSLVRFPNVQFHERRSPLPALGDADDLRYAAWRARAQAQLAAPMRAAYGAE